MSEVFISYVRENKDTVDRLASELTTRGAKVWLDRNELEPGIFWKDAISKAIANGSYFIACFSKASQSRRKTHMNEEIILGIEELRKYPPDAKFFIPVLLDECEVPAFSLGAGRTLLDLQWVPLYENWGTGINRIAQVVIEIKKKI